MKLMPCPFLYLVLIFSLCVGCQQREEHAKTTLESEERERFSVIEAQRWFDEHGWLVGCNFIPSTAINQLEMWQAETFDTATINKELGWASEIGMNIVRVYLHDLIWDADSTDFISRIDQFLTIASDHGISTMFVIFDGVWRPDPKLGVQMEPIPHVHNSGWVQSPSHSALTDTTEWPRLERYVRGLMNHFGDDDRIAAWDVFNEPDNSRHELTVSEKYDWSFALLRQTFTWCRSLNPKQPLTTGIWYGDWHPDSLNALNIYQLEESDIISFHTYDEPMAMHQKALLLKRYNRPMICTEYLARGNNNDFHTMLPFFKENQIGAINWGLVDGKTNTIYPWDSWSKKYISEPELWHHDIFRADGTAYRQDEIALIKKLTGH
jgi:hypothetical protein